LICRKDVRSAESSPLKKSCIIQVVSLHDVGRFIGSAFKLDTLYHHQTPGALNFPSVSHVRSHVENLMLSMTSKKMKVIVNTAAFWTCNGKMLLKWIMVIIVTTFVPLL
jgi:hypothetical protein